MKRSLTILTALLALGVLSGCQNQPDPSSELPTSDESETSLPTETTSEEVEVPQSPNRVFTPAPAYTGNYWDEIVNSELQGKDLANALYEFKLSRFTPIDYNTCVEALELMDVDPDDEYKVLSIYDLNSVQFKKRHDGDNFTPREVYFDREHAYPQSKLADGDDSKRAGPTKKNISTDVANLFFCDGNLNQAKSNYSYWGLSMKEQYYKFAIRNKFGTLTDNFVYNGMFSPTPMVRGEIARSQLYMLVMWPYDKLGYGCSLDENFNILTMLQWNLEYPPTVERDLQRQKGLELYQNLRNPFIDHPELACRIWGEYDVNGRFCH